LKAIAMQNMMNKQIIRSIKKSLSSLDFTNLDERCSNEAQTRFNLIEPLLEILGYSRIDDMATEINAGWGKKNDKADIGLILRGNKPEVIIECKKFGKNLTDKEASQLSNYFVNTEHSKIGILTNGLEWLIYAPNQSKRESKLYELPFMSLDFSEIDETLIENFAKLHKNSIDLKELVEEAQEFFFLENFSDALCAELADPSDNFIKALYTRMGGNRLTTRIENKLRDMVNARAIQEVLPQVMERESENGSIVITTAEELKIYHSIKTILIAAIKNLDANRISYRDLKGSFNIILDSSNRNLIAKVSSSKGKMFVEIDGEKHEADELDSIVNLKKQLVDTTKHLIEIS